MSDVPINFSTTKFFNAKSENLVLNAAESKIDCWLDCDPGHDDAIAIILAYFNARINLLGISTTAGNQGLEKTTRNALNVLNIIGAISNTQTPKNGINEHNSDLKLRDSMIYGGLKVPVIKGVAKPLLRPSVICAEIHGESGLEGAQFPLIPQNAFDFTNKISHQLKHFTTSIYELFKSSNSKVTVIITGPMTNIALLMLNYPDVVNYIEKIVFMGGACGAGNTGPSAEFNIQVDPEAAHVIFESNIDIYMVPLEVTHTLLVTSNVLNRIKSINTPFSELIIDLLLFFKKTYHDVFGFDDPPLHDPAAVAFIINPNIFHYRLMRVDIETHSNLSYGQTVCDIYNMSNKRKNVHVCLRIDIDQFWKLIIDAINQADKMSPLNKSTMKLN